MKKYVFALSFLLAVLLSACGGSEQASEQSVQTAIAQTAQAEGLVGTSVAATLAAHLTDTPSYDYSTWGEYNAPEGFTFYYPPRFNPEQRGEELPFISLVEEGAPGQEISFVVIIREQATAPSLGEVKIAISLDNSIFIDFFDYAFEGFLVSGQLPGDGFGGGSTIYTAYFELGDLQIEFDCPWNYCDKDEFDLILRSFKLKE